MIHRRAADDLFAARLFDRRRRDFATTCISEGFITTRLMVNVSVGLGLEGRRPRSVLGSLLII